jgi:outer membrane receptor protein involved in Fe transport
MFNKSIYLISVILLTLFSNNIYSQNSSPNNISLTGKVKEGEKNVEFASVVLKNSENKIVAGALTDSLGVFRLKASKVASYKLEISFIGYQTKILDITLKEGENKLTEPIMINASVNLLNEASVTASYNEKQTDIERTKINPSASIAASRGSITDLLRSASMVQIDNNNSISIRGNSNILILIDGIPSTLGSLAGVPASLAQSIEIITNPDAKYDSEGTGGIINIITKKENRDGFSLASSLNYGFPDRINGDANIMFNALGWKFGFGYSGKYHVEKVSSELDRFFYSTSNSIEQKIESVQKQKTNSLIFNAIKKFSNGDQLTLNFKYVKPEINNNQQIINLSTTSSNTTFVNRENEFHHLRDMGEAVADYRKILKKDVSDITFRGSFSRTKGQRPARYFEDDVFVLKSLGGGHPTNYSFQTDYTFKAPNKTLIEAGIRYFHRGNSFKFDTYQYDSFTDDWVFNDFFSTDLTHGEDIGSAYFNLSGKLKQDLSYKLGLRTEYGVSDLIIVKENEAIHTNNIFLAPFLLIKKDFNSQSSLSFSLSRRITRPTYPQINPYVNMLDKSVYETGNRYIKPEQITKVELMYNYSKNGTSLNASLFYSTISDFITQVSSLYGDDALMLTYVNGKRSEKTGIDINLRHKVSPALSFNSGGNLYYGITTGSFNGFDLASNSVMWSGNAAVNITPDKKSDISLQYFYTSPATYPQFKTKAVHFLDIAIKRLLIKDKLSASLTLSDALNTRRWDISSDNSIYRLKNNSKNQSRVLWIGLTFNLNRMQQAKSQKRDEEGEQQGLIRIGY